MKRFIITCLVLLVASGAMAYTTGQWINPSLCNIDDSMLFRVDNDCSTWGNDSACFWWLNCQVGLGGPYNDFWDGVPTRYGCSTKTEQECWETVGQASIDWTYGNKPDFGETNEQLVNQILAENFGGGGGDPINNAPVAVDDSYTVEQDTVLTVSAPGVLGNDTDADGDTMEATRTAFPAHGTSTMSPNGSFTYTPYSEYVGTDTFQYKVNDGTDDSAIATVTITVTEAGGQDPPPDCDECQQALTQCQADKQALIDAIQAALDAAQ